MSDISEIVVNGTTYDIKDTTARSSGGSSSPSSTENPASVLMEEELQADSSAIILENISLKRFILLCLPKGTTANSAVGTLKLKLTFANGKTLEISDTGKITSTNASLLWSSSDIRCKVEDGICEVSIGHNGSKNDTLFNNSYRPTTSALTTPMHSYWEEGGYDSIVKIELCDSTSALIGAGTKIKIVGV